MTATNHYHDRIARATERLAQLQARELLASQRRETKVRNATKREHAKRRQRVATVVELAGAYQLSDEELAGAILNHMDARTNSSDRQLAADRGTALLGKIGRVRPFLSH